jgi:hypothetical protein
MPILIEAKNHRITHRWLFIDPFKNQKVARTKIYRRSMIVQRYQNSAIHRSV